MRTASNSDGSDDRRCRSGGWVAYCEAARSIAEEHDGMAQFPHQDPHAEGSREDADCDRR